VAQPAVEGLKRCQVVDQATAFPGGLVSSGGGLPRVCGVSCADAGVGVVRVDRLPQVAGSAVRTEHGCRMGVVGVEVDAGFGQDGADDGGAVGAVFGIRTAVDLCPGGPHSMASSVGNPIDK
jgi:hypothetical protein